MEASGKRRIGKGSWKSSDRGEQISVIVENLAPTRVSVFQDLTPWQRGQIARHVQRPYMLDYVSLAFTDFCELHGDRHIGDDKSMPGGLAMLGDQKVMLIGHQKGRDTKENLLRNFGSAHPEGYRKAIRLMRLAEKFRIPIVCLLATPGAFPGIGAAEHTIAEATGSHLREPIFITVPFVPVGVGTGGSGGALCYGVGKFVLNL